LRILEEKKTTDKGLSMSSENLRVLHVSTWKAACGIATYCDNLVKSLAEQGVESGVVPLRPTDWLYYLPDDVQRWRETIIEEAKSYDLVHFQHEHGLYGHARSSKFATKQFGKVLQGVLKLGKPAITTFHTDILTGRGRSPIAQITKLRRKMTWGKHVTQHFGNQSGKARAIVHTLQTRLSFARHGMDPSGIHVMPHACLPPKSISMEQGSAKKHLGLPEGAKLLTIFGFLGKYKGHDLAIESLKFLPDHYHLAIVGGMHPESRDPFLDDVIEGIPDNLRSRVHITGWVDIDIANTYYAATDVCLAPYRAKSELSASGAITWALSSGKPVIASKIEAFQSVDRQATCMFLVTPEKLREMAWAVEKVVNDEPLRNRLITNAREYCLEHSWQSTAEKTVDLYRETLNLAPLSAQRHRVAA
jgi:glycosyltransferase involved in cell wall biosynthesis